MKITVLILFILAGSWFRTSCAYAAYQQKAHTPLDGNAVAVSAPGNYAVAGTTYQLLQNISSAHSPVFLGRDVTLDLNGYTITYADTNYQHIPNYGFEEGLAHWDMSAAPNAKIEDDKVQVFIGRHVLRLSKGEEIVSEYITLPVANRSWFALCGVIAKDMKISLFVEDENGQPLQCYTTIGDSTTLCCPIINRSPRMGGGFITAHIHGQPAGRYRVRVRAETDCLVDHIDLRPAMDVGISIVENTQPYAHNDNLHKLCNPAFFDFTVSGSSHEPVAEIPQVHGSGTIVIKNGVIKSGAVGILSWGIQSTAKDVHIILDNVKIVAGGINTNAVDVPHATITNCLFDINTPFIINRHVSEHAVVLRGADSSSVSHSEFYGGQGCLTIKGENSEVHDNLFVNRQTVTNHYSVMAMGDGSHIYRNLFKPEIGSGVEIFRHKRIHIYENEFHIKAAPPSCEYGHQEYSTTAIRVADYGAAPGSARGCADNRIYKNTFYITGLDYPEYPDYVPMAWAFFHSVSGGDTYIYDNDIIVDNQAPASKAEAAAFYIGGSENGGIWENNRITTNGHAVWVATRYSGAANAVLIGNTITQSEDALPDVSPVRIGWEYPNVVATNITFDSNVFHNKNSTFSITDENHTFSVSWRLTVHLVNKQKKPLANVLVSIYDVNGEKISGQQTDENGKVQFKLTEFIYKDKRRIYASPYTIQVADKSWEIKLDKNREIELELD